MLVKVLYNGEEFAIESSKAELVKEFRKKVFEHTRLKPSCQNLMYGGKFLSDKNQANLCDYRIEDGYKVHLFNREPLHEVKKNNNANVHASDVNENDSKKDIKREATPPPPFEDERDPDQPMDSNAESGPSNLSKEEQIAKLKEIGAGEDLIAELENDIEAAPAPEPEQCAKCKKNPERKCRECGCKVCGGKEDPDVQLFCEECQYVTHIYCLDPPIEREQMDALPDEWYCPDCKRDENEIIQKGEAVRLGKRAKMPSNAKPQKRDWGNGKATAGVDKKCTIVEPHHFGPIPGIDVGMSWQYRVQVAATGVHRPPVAGISGQGDIGCQSIVLAGGYEDDKDEGDMITYTGAGGRDLSGNKRTDGQSFDQRLDKTNLSLAVSCDAPVNHGKEGAKAKDWKKSKPIRVLRSYKGSIAAKGHPASKYAPAHGIRYDGIYKMVSYKNTVGKSGKRVWQFVLKRDDPAPAPWEDGAPVYSCIIEKPEQAKKEKEEFEKKRRAQGVQLVTATNPGPTDPIFEPTDDLLNLISADKKNKNKWDEILEKKVRKDKWYENVEEEFTCIGCALVVGDPVTLPCCGHSACLKCLEKFHKGKLEEADRGKKINRECWACRYDLQDEEYKAYKNKELKAALEFIFPGYANKRIAAKDEPKNAPKKARNRATPKRKAAAELSFSEAEDSFEEVASTLTEKPKMSTDEPSPSIPKKRPGPKSRTIDDEAASKSPQKPEKITKIKIKPGPKSRKQDSKDYESVVDEKTPPTPGTSKAAKKAEKPGPKSRKRNSEPLDDEEVIDEPRPPKKAEKPGPKSRKRKWSESIPAIDDDKEDDDLEAKKLNKRQRKLLGEIDYNID